MPTALPPQMVPLVEMVDFPLSKVLPLKKEENAQIKARARVSFLTQCLAKRFNFGYSVQYIIQEPLLLILKYVFSGLRSSF